MDIRKIKLISAIGLSAIMLACTGSKTTSPSLITVNVEENYPEKELILQDFAEVEYVALESTDEWVTKGFVKAIGKDAIVVTNSGSDGDIFVFDRKTGKGIRKINHTGQSGEEYVQMTEIVWDEENNEMFVVDYPGRKVLVYDLQGNYKRSFKFADDSYYSYTYNYDKNHLITFKGYSPQFENENSCHVLISKQDGSVVREIGLPFKEIATPVYIGAHEQYGEVTVMPQFFLTVPSPDGWKFTKTSCDTVYQYVDGKLQPFMVRTPSIHSMNPQVFLYPTALLGRYCFMYTQKKEVKMKTLRGFPSTELVYDKQENAAFECTVQNADFVEKHSVSFIATPISEEVVICQLLNASDLVEAYQDGKLKGRLKEIAATLGEEDNPVLMLVKRKDD